MTATVREAAEALLAAIDGHGYETEHALVDEIAALRTAFAAPDTGLVQRLEEEARKRFETMANFVDIASASLSKGEHLAYRHAAALARESESTARDDGQREALERATRAVCPRCRLPLPPARK